jgi:hypothetical protein
MLGSELMRIKGHPKGRLTLKEKKFFAKRKASITERRRERETSQE